MKNHGVYLLLVRNTDAEEEKNYLEDLRQVAFRGFAHTHTLSMNDMQLCVARTSK